MSNYKIGLLIFSNSKAEMPSILHMFNTVLKTEEFGVVKLIEMLNQDKSLINLILDQYLNTNLGMIVMVAPGADIFFKHAELEEVGHQKEKFLVTLNLDSDLKKNFLGIINKVKASPGKPFRGCDSSCR